MSGAESEPRVIATGRSKEPARPRRSRRCLRCGYDLTGIVLERGRSCPECGTPIGEAVGMSWLIDAKGEAVRRVLARGARLAWLGLVLYPVPMVGALIETAGWFRLTGAGAVAGSSLVSFVARLLTGLSLAAHVAALFAVLDGYVWHAVIPFASADYVAGGVVVGLVLIWTARHAAASWMLRGFARRLNDPGLEKLALVSGLGGVAVTLTGVALIVVGGLILHIALFPPFCFALPLWFGGAAVWLAANVTLLARLSEALSEGVSSPSGPH